MTRWQEHQPQNVRTSAKDTVNSIVLSENDDKCDFRQSTLRLCSALLLIDSIDLFGLMCVSAS